MRVCHVSSVMSTLHVGCVGQNVGSLYSLHRTTSKMLAYP